MAKLLHIGFFVPLAAAVACTLPVAAQDAGDQAFGQYVLDVLETAQTAESISDKLRSRSVEIRAGRDNEGAVTEEERRWYERWREQEHVDEPGGGPPPWAPAHGYRRKFGADQERDLGGFTHRRVQEGLSGVELVIAVRDAVERVTRGEPIEVERGEADRRRHESQQVDRAHETERERKIERERERGEDEAGQSAPGRSEHPRGKGKPAGKGPR